MSKPLTFEMLQAAYDKCIKTGKNHERPPISPLQFGKLKKIHELEPNFDYDIMPSLIDLKYFELFEKD